MSYQIVKTIKIDEKNGEVWMGWACNNVRPRDFTPERCKMFEGILKKEGIKALDLAIMRGYECGNMQGGRNKYTRALANHHAMPEYARFNWRGTADNWEAISAWRDNNKADLDALLAVAFDSKPIKIATPYYLRNSNGDYIYKVFARSIRFGGKFAKRKQFAQLEDAERLQQRLHGGWTVLSA